VDVFGVFFFQAEDGIRDFHVTGVQTCALPICVQELSRTAVRLLDADASEQQAVAAYCEQTRMDYAFLADIQLLRECRILAMDMRSEERRVGKEGRTRGPRGAEWKDTRRAATRG